ncbi:MAG: thioesterase [Pseudonocardiales bacterium]|nr:thioesterase [Pseudonocardiales bacterium]
MPANNRDRWVRCFHPTAETSPQVVCFPHAGGAASYYFALSRALTPHVEVVAVQYPGHQDRFQEPLIDNIPVLAEEIVARLRTMDDRRPRAFFGHSMGSIVAFEVARRLHQAGVQGPHALLVSGRRGPAVQRVERYHLLADEDFIAELRAIDGTDPSLLADPDLLDMILRVARADYKAIETYECPPNATLPCPIVALVGDADPRARVAEVAAWAGHTTGKFDMKTFPGGHFYLNTHWPHVAEVIRYALGTETGRGQLARPGGA